MPGNVNNKGDCFNFHVKYQRKTFPEIFFQKTPFYLEYRWNFEKGQCKKSKMKTVYYLWGEGGWSKNQK